MLLGAAPTSEPVTDVDAAAPLIAEPLSDQPSSQPVLADPSAGKPADPPGTKPLPTMTPGSFTNLTEARAPTEGPSRFRFGSYGRFGVFTNQLGKDVQTVNAATRIPRLDKRPYLEIYLGYERALEDLGQFIVMLTPAIAGDPFHYTGKFEAALALRNAYVGMAQLGGTGLKAWAGSRMYRGDDAYLLDFWPLDDLNTLGGAIGYEAHGFDAEVHVGASRVLGSNFFSQQILVADPQSGVTEISINNRQRLIGSLKASYYRQFNEWIAAKAKLYMEGHSIAGGAVELKGNLTQTLPSDSGYVIGGQVSFFQPNTRNYLHLFLRHGNDLGAYPALATPYGLNAQRKTTGARDTLFAFSLSTLFIDRIAGSFAGYYRSFNDAQNDAFSATNLDEFAMAVRVQGTIWKFIQQGVEVSYQRTHPKSIQPDLLRQISPEVFKFSLLPTLASAPHLLPEFALRLVYTYTKTNSDTRYLFPVQDLRHSTRDFHFFGVQGEWLLDKAL